MSARNREQISVPLPPKLRERLEALAQREDRTLAGQVRHLLAEATQRPGSHLDDGRPAP